MSQRSCRTGFYNRFCICSGSKIKVWKFAFTIVNFVSVPHCGHTLYAVPVRKRFDCFFSFTDVTIVLESCNELIDLFRFGV